MRPERRGLRAVAPARFRHFHPDLREPPGLVDGQLPPSHVRAVVDFQDDVGQGVGAACDLCAAGPCGGGADVDDLVRLEEALLAAVFALDDKVRGADHVDGRPAPHGDHLDAGGEPLPGVLVMGGGAFGQDRDLVARVPVLQTALVVVQLFAGDRLGAAAGELVGLRRRALVRRRRGWLGDRFGHVFESTGDGVACRCSGTPDPGEKRMKMAPPRNRGAGR